MPRLVLCLLLLALGADPSPRAGEYTLRVVSYNIRHGVGMDDSLDLERTARTLRALDADIIALQEVDDRVQRSGGVAQADSLGRALGMHAAFGSFMPYQGGRYGLALLSRSPIVRADTVRLRDGNEPRVALSILVERADGTQLRVVNVHYDWVGADSFRYAQAERVALHLDSLRVPYVLLGDFNDHPGSRTLQLFQARAKEAAKPAGARFTFPASVPVREIDFIFASPAAEWTVLEARVVEEPVASDHRPVLAVLRHE